MSLTNLPRPSASMAGVTARRLAVLSLSSRRLPAMASGARRAYWTFRCTKSAAHTSTYRHLKSAAPYQYWCSGPARYRHWKGWEGPAAYGQESKEESEVRSQQLPRDKEEAKNGEPIPSGENKVQSEEQRFLADEWAAWEKAARRHANIRLDLLRFALEKDPYAVMFGGREARGVWNPWKHGFWRWPSLWERWGRGSKGMLEYLETRSESMEKTVGEKRAAREGFKQDQQGAKKVSETEIKIVQNDGTAETTEVKGTWDSTKIPSVQSGDVYIDLITLRKVQRTATPEKADLVPPPPPPPSQPQQPPKKDEGVKITVKTYTKPNVDPAAKSFDSSKKDDKQIAGFASQEWLKREGFASKSIDSLESSRPAPRSKSPSPAPKAVYVPPIKGKGPSEIPKTQSAQVQSVLDRWPASRWTRKSSEPSTPDAPAIPFQQSGARHLEKSPTPGLKDRLVYEPKDETTDDVDLLRASDVRAKSGKIKSTIPVPTAEEIAERRNALGSQFAQSQRRFEIALRKEIIDALQNNTLPVKSPLWALWMQYDHAGRKDWNEWLRKRSFTLKDEEELKEMQYMSRAFLEQMPSPSEIFESGGTSMSRYLDANRMSMALQQVQAGLSRWHMHMQSTLVPRGVQPFSQDVLDNMRKALMKYHIELRRQILTGEGPQIIRTNDPRKEQRRVAADLVLAKEVATQRAAMERHEEQSRVSRNQSAGKGIFVPWMPPGTQQRSTEVNKAVGQAERDATLGRELRNIYEAEYGKITTQHRQPLLETEAEASPVPLTAEMEGQRIVWDELTQAVEAKNVTASMQAEEQGQRVVWDEPEAAPLPNKGPTTPKANTVEPPPAPKPKPRAGETATILLTLARRTGALTTHPVAIWRVLHQRSGISPEASPLESHALCSFLQVAADPQGVLRKVVGLQGQGFRLVSSRKGCLVFQQMPSIGDSLESLATAAEREVEADKVRAKTELPKTKLPKAETQSEPINTWEDLVESARRAVKAEQSGLDQQLLKVEPVKAKPTTPNGSAPSTTTASPSTSQQMPVPSIISKGPAGPLPGAPAIVEPKPTAPQKVPSPAPSQPMRRAEPHFSGRTSAPPSPQSTLSSGKIPSLKPTTPPITSKDSHPPPPPPAGSSRHEFRRHRRRRGMRRSVRFVGRILRSAILMAMGAYVAGLWLEWRRERRRLVEVYGEEGLQHDLRDGNWKDWRGRAMESEEGQWDDMRKRWDAGRWRERSAGMAREPRASAGLARGHERGDGTLNAWANTGDGPAPTADAPDLLRRLERWWDRVWWLMEGDTRWRYGERKGDK